MDVPRGFVEHHEGGSLLVVESGIAAPVRALDPVRRLSDPGRSQSGSGGRGATFVLALGESGPRLLVRRVVRGGLRGRLPGADLVRLARPLAELRVTALLV